jgi:sorbitol/mannitol transport system substrate-binding protein
MTDRDNDINGICLRGKAGWGEGGAFITVTGNSFGARWFDEDWNAQFDQPEWKEALTFFVEMMGESGPAGYATNGFNENLSLFQQGKCGMWIDATVAASFVTNPNDSTVADKVGFALAPNMRAWQTLQLALGLGAGDSGRHPEGRCGQAFIEWATSKDYIELVARRKVGPTFLRARAPRCMKTPNIRTSRSRR